MNYVAGIRIAKPKAKRRRGVDREGQEQQAYFNWLRLQFPDAYEHAFHPPNGGKRSKAEAGLFKAQGVKAGVQDIFIDQPRGAYHGLRIELKATPPHDAAVTDTQKGWALRSNAAGYHAVICKGFDAAVAATISYLRLPPFDGVTRIEVAK